MSETALLRLPRILAEQAQKHVTHNEALAALDLLVQLAVLDRDLAAPPGAPAEGDRYIVAAGASGAWAGKDLNVAAWQDGAWAFHAPRTGWRAWVADEAALVYWTGAAWADYSAAIDTLQNLALLGIGTMADATNPFSAKLNKALWTAKTAAEGGDGDLRYTMNKEAAADVLSLLLQSGFSGRAELGLIGDDDLTLKVSADGASWKEALRVDRASGVVSFPRGTTWSRETLAAARTYYVDAATGSDADDGLTAATAFATLQKAVDTLAGIDMGGLEATISVAAGTYAEAVVLKSLIGGNATIVGDETTPANVTVAPAAGDCLVAEDALGRWWLKGLKLTASQAGKHCILVGANSSVQYQNVDFGSTNSGKHILARNGGVAEATGNCTISGGAAQHWAANNQGVIRFQNKTLTLVGTPAFGGAFLESITLGLIIAGGNTFSGAATGKRYDIRNNSVVNTSGQPTTYFPGDVAGTTANGGLYV